MVGAGFRRKAETVSGGRNRLGRVRAILSTQACVCVVPVQLFVQCHGVLHRAAGKWSLIAGLVSVFSNTGYGIGRGI